ncbi:MAG: GH92 family glycosyl hydrolase [Ignavibacteria bacterium]|nr:GH92 family glycosyl hydrolase [Ignavibacteria bacterium]
MEGVTRMRFFVVVLFTAFSLQVFAQPAKQPVDYVNPLIGTDDMGHTFPGASVPFGLVQLSPDTDTAWYSYGKGYNPDVYKYCAGYQYTDKTIVGFSHTHFNGTGHSDLGDFLIMPTTGPAKLNPGTSDVPRSGYRSAFSHETEKAEAGYYAVTLADYNIRAELTATRHVGIHRYTFPSSAQAHIILDMTAGIYNYEGKVVWASVRVENDHLITGYRQTNGWGRTRLVYFAMEFSQPIISFTLQNNEQLVYKGFWRKFNENDNFPERAGHRVQCSFNFDVTPGKPVTVKVALSGVSTRNALLNLQEEAPGWDFDTYRASARNLWQTELEKIQVTADDDTKANFYTSLYHTMLNPSVFSDVNGEYRGLDQNIYTLSEGRNYTVFSLWDTFRALHPLFTIIQPSRDADMVRSMLAHYRQSVHKMLPVWSHFANENWCMTGYHAVPAVTDAALKGLVNPDLEQALYACTATAEHDSYEGIGAYRKFGFVPEDVSGNSASKTLEYAYDDWTIARLAEALGKDSTARIYYTRAESWKKLYDPEIHFIRPRNSNGKFKEPFDPLSTVNQGFIEGNTWNYSLFVPHDIKGLIYTLGGPGRLISWLDSLFAVPLPDKYFGENEDLTKDGMIGGYVHGNEPSHHIAYMYVYAGVPWKTQERVHEIMKTMYKPLPHGLCGNDDCGQMSAWYVFSALGFYPVTPGSNQYVFGSPLVSGALLRLENGATLNIRVTNSGSRNIYIQKIMFQGRELSRLYITHDEILQGGELEFVMGDKPVIRKDYQPDDFPYSMTKW